MFARLNTRGALALFLVVALEPRAVADTRIEAKVQCQDVYGGTSDLDWAARLTSCMHTKCCGWTAWSWVDHPVLVRDARNCDYTPTAFGEWVRSELLRRGFCGAG